MIIPYQKKIQLPDGRVIIIETGKLAKQAHGSVVVKMDKTMLLATVVAADEAKEDVDFMPLSVEYRENFASAGRFPGGFTRREGKPSDSEILISRLIDRALRPLFPEDFHAEVFVNVTLISADKDIMPDAMAGLAASAALSISDIPFGGPISECRVGRIDGKFVINPTFSELQNSDIDIMVGATYENILMVEGEMDEVSEKDMLDAIKFAHDAIKTMCIAQKEMMVELNKTNKRQYCHEEKDEELRKKIWDSTYKLVYDVAKQGIANKKLRSQAFEDIKNGFITANYPEGSVIPDKLIAKYYHQVEKEAVRNVILNEGIRLDGRKCDEIRPIWCEVDYLPAAHGSAIFTRGETQSLTTVTLGTRLDDKIVDEVLKQGRDKFLLHYNFPPFSTGEARPYRGVGRREIGHGNLAHRALKKVFPNGEENPYAVRIVSDILESNGSSSMATVCAGTLALMDAGIKIRKPVSGIAMGLITDSKTGKWAVLSDILGDEDHLGDMDFKVAGTENGITATQMDIKVDGLTYDILEKALAQANAGRKHILSKILETLAEPRPELKPHAPRIQKLTIPKEMIGAVIGPGGKIIQDIQNTTGATIVIEEVDNYGIVDVFADNAESIKAAVRRIEAIVAVPEIGKIYEGPVKSIVSFGAFIEILPNKDGLLHVSEIAWSRVVNVEDVLKVGEIVQVKLLDIDKGGKLKLSRKVLLPKPENTNSEQLKKKEKSE